MLTREVVAADFNTNQYVIEPGNYEQLAGSNGERRAVTVVNDPDSLASVYVVNTENKARQLVSGVRVAADRELILPVTAPVYGYVPEGANPATVYVIELVGE